MARSGPCQATLPDQVCAVAQLLASTTRPLARHAIEACFKSKGPWEKGLPRILETLKALGLARRKGDGWQLTAPDADCVLTMLAVVKGELSESGFAAWLRTHAAERPNGS